MKSVDVLMTNQMASFVVKNVESRYRLHKLWEAEDPQALIDKIAGDVQFIMCTLSGTSVDGAFMSQFPKLKGVVNYGVGYDCVDAKWAGEHGIVVTNTPDVLNNEVADLSLGLTLAVIRQIPRADRFVREGAWEKGGFPLTASLAGRTMGILGLGRIGKAIAKRAEAFGLKVVYHGRHRQDGVAYSFYANFKEMARACDILLLIAPGTAETHHIVNAEILEALGPEGVLINMARGSLVDQDALIAALEAGTILSAGLDVYAQEPHVPQRLIDLPQVVLLPHVGSASVVTRTAIGQLVIDNLDALAEGKRALTPVAETPLG